jgi:hypothetical protein
VKVPGKKKRQRVGSVPQSVDRARRMRAVCRRLRELIAGRTITAIAVEQMLMFGPAAAVSANVLPWGAAAMLADVLGVPLVEVVSVLWQHGVLGTDLTATTKPPKVKRAALERAMAAFIGRHAGSQLEAIDKDLRNHAIDAVGVGMLAALRPGDARWIVEQPDRDLNERTAA